MADHRSGSTESAPEPLTRREQEILVCLADGLSNQEIANRLYLAETTIRWYNAQIYSKLGVGKRQDAVARAKTLGLLDNVVETPLPAGKHNLPSQATPFVGRQHQLGDLAALLSDPNARLITILAPGGMGKTRLSLEAARTQVGHFVDGVFFVPLAPLSDANDIVTTIAEHIGFSFYGEIPPAQQLLAFLRDRSLLLVLDNFEHLLTGASFVSDMVQAAPGLRVLTTSRERLNLQGETVCVLRGLDFPDWQSPQLIETYDAVKLFLQTAQRVHPGFALQAHDLMHLAQICHLTAGMPLAIELAAGWIDILPLERIASEIQQGIDILETNLRDVPERQRSVRATFEITWSRLTDEEQAIFGSLSVFRGGFTLSAAQAIAGANARQLRGLAQKALIQTEGTERFAIHELLRQFGADKLEETGELPTIQGNHAAFFADFMQERRSAIFGSQQYEALDQIRADFENVRTAWYVLVERQAFDQLPKFLDGLQFFFDLHNRWQEGVELFETTVNIVQLLPPSDATELTLGRLWVRLGWFYNSVGSSEKGGVTVAAALERFDRYESLEDRLVAYQGLALISMFRGESEKTRQYAELARTLARQLGDPYWEAHSLLLLGYARRQAKDDVDAISHLVRQGRAIFENLGNLWGTALSYETETGTALYARDYEQAKYWATKCQVLAKAVDSPFLTGTSGAYLAFVALWQEDYSQAWDWLRQSLRALWDVGYTQFFWGPMLLMAQLLLLENKPERAVEILAQKVQYPGYFGFGALFETSPDWVEELRANLEARLGADRFVAAWARGLERDRNEVVIELLSQKWAARL